MTMDHGPIGRLRTPGAWFEERYCRVDLRWLGIFRILLSLLLCVDLLRRWAHATDFYTNQGLLPNHFSLFRPLGRDVFSIYHAFSTLPEVNVAFALTLVVFVVFGLGYRTRLFHVLSLLCITSLNARNLLVENGGTVVVNLICFWTLFFPLGRRLSLDSLLATLRREASRADLEGNPPTGDEGAAPSEVVAAANAHYSLLLFVLLFQWSAIYFFNVVHKSGVGWRDGTALHWFLHQDRIVTAFGIFAREHAPLWLLKGFTYGTLGVEAALTVLLLVPFQPIWCRRIALVFALALHGGIAATSRLGPFSYAMSVFFVLPLTATDWNWLSRRLRSPAPTLTVIYDADCGICFLGCRILKELDLLGKLRFVGNDRPDQIPPELSPELLDQTFAVVDANGQIALRERGLSRVLGALPFAGFGSGFLLRLPGVSALARAGYVWFATRRHAISSRLGLGVCGVQSPGASTSTAAAELAGERLWPMVGWRPLIALRETAVIVALVMTCIQLAKDNDWARRRGGENVPQPAALLRIMDFFRLYQGWRMFAPEPPYDDGRVVVDARTRDGRKVDPLTGLEPDFNTDTKVGWGHSQLWCDWHLKMYFSRYAANRQHLKDWLLSWHERTGNPEDRVVAFDVWWVNDKSPPPGQLLGTPQKPVQLLTFGQVKDSGAKPWL